MSSFRSHRAWWLPLRASGTPDSFNLTLLEAEVCILLWRCWLPPEGPPCDRCFNVVCGVAKIINGLFAQYSHLTAPWAAEMGWRSLHTAPETAVGGSACLDDIPSPSTLQTNPSTNPNPSSNPNPSIQFSSVQFSRSVLSDSLQPHELQHARPPCPLPYSNS